MGSLLIYAVGSGTVSGIIAFYLGDPALAFATWVIAWGFTMVCAFIQDLQTALTESNKENI